MHRKLFGRKLFGKMPAAATILACLLATTAGIMMLFVTPGAAQEGISAKVDQYIKAEMQSQRIPGLSLAVMRDGQIIFAKGYGLADTDGNIREAKREMADCSPSCFDNGAFKMRQGNRGPAESI